MELSQTIKSFRKRAGISQMELELSIDVSPGVVSRIESGQINPSKDTLLRIIRALKILPHEAAILFNLDFNIGINSILHASKQLFEAKDMDNLLQAAVNDITKTLGFLSGFVTIVEGDRLYAKTATQQESTKLSFSMISIPFNQLNIKLDHKENFMVRVVRERQILISNYLKDFVVGVIPNRLANLIQKTVNLQSGIALPIVYNDEVLGAIMFCKTYKDDFKLEKDILVSFSDNIGLAIHQIKKHKFNETLRKD